MKTLLLLVATVGLALGAHGGCPSLALAQTAQPTAEPLRVAVKSIEPFVFIEGQRLDGFSIDLWREIARVAELDYRFDIVDTVQAQLKRVAGGEAGAAIAAISVTQEREALVDFSLPYFNSGLGILTARSEDPTPVLDALRAGKFTLLLLRLIALLLAVIVIAGHSIWLLERRRNPDFPKGYLRGVWEGIWWAAVTVTTVGYGDRTPKSIAGRIFGLFWMFAGLFIIANFTASVTSQLTLQEIRGAINGPQDLYGKKVAAVEGSTGDAWLDKQRIGNTAVKFVQDALALLEAGKVQAVVYDYPVLLYHAAKGKEKGFEVVGEAFNKEAYGIAFPHGHPARKKVNLALLRLIESGVYDQLYSKWFGADPNR